ncbi:MAG: sugar kinase [Rubellimicrobium sp.]|nr:sugar kinase [Rubellimicrobium sp.]
MVELSHDAGDLWRLGYAGDVLNTAWYARALLPQAWEVGVFTRLGPDPFSPRMTAFMADNGLSTRFISRDPARSIGLYSIELHEGERSFAYWRGQSAARGLADDAQALVAAIAAADVVHFSGITLAILPPEARLRLIDAVGGARARGALTAFDPNIRPRLWESADAMRAALAAAAGAASVALPSFDDEAAWFGDADLAACAARWRASGAGEVVVKNGGGPIHVSGKDGDAQIGVDRVAPLDSTGAGDAFNGGYIAARLAGRPPEDAARAGHALSLQVIGQPGALVPMDRLTSAAPH